jgi:hypothetical protein
VLAQEPQPLTAGGPEARHAQPCPDLAVTLPMEGRGREDGPDRLDQIRLRPWPGRPRWPGRQAMALDGDPRRTPDPAQPRQRAAALKGRDIRPPRPGPAAIRPSYPHHPPSRRIPPACRMSHSTARRRSHSAGDTSERDLRRNKAKLSRAVTIRQKSNRHHAR